LFHGKQKNEQNQSITGVPKKQANQRTMLKTKRNPRCPEVIGRVIHMFGGHVKACPHCRPIAAKHENQRLR
jgi:hypothetical protein